MSFEEVKGLAGRLMDRACVRRARGLREKIGYVDQADDAEGFYLLRRKNGERGRQSIEAFAERWSRARTGIVLTAHPTFGLSDALYRRMVEIAVSAIPTPTSTIGLPHRPEPTLTLQHEHKCAQDAIRNLRNAYEELLHGFYSVASQKFGDAAFKLRPKLTTFASWVGYDLDGRTDIAWTFSFEVRLREKRAALADVRERFVVLKHKLESGDAAQRVARQIVGKLDLGIAAVDEQLKALESFTNDTEGLAKAANVITKTDGYNLLTVEPLQALFNTLIDTVQTPQMKRATAALAGLARRDGPWHVAHSFAHQRAAAAQRLPRLRA